MKARSERHSRSRLLRPARGAALGRVPVAVLVALLMIAAFPFAPAGASSRPASNGFAPSVPSPPVTGPLTSVTLGPYSSIVPGSAMVNRDPGGILHVVLTLDYSNRSGLDAFLRSLSDPSSPLYHHFLTAAEFDARFSPSSSQWASVASYVRGYAVTNFTATPDRTTVAFDASIAALDQMFHTTLEQYRGEGHVYIAPSSGPSLPRSLAAALVQVSGLSTYSQYVIRTLGGRSALPTRPPVPLSTPTPRSPAPYIPPVTHNGVQLEYAPDFQVAYDEPSLFQEYGYPTNASVATILWSGTYSGSTISTPCGTLTNGQNVGPWVPSDVEDFFNETLPTAQPHSVLTAVPINGAPSPSCLASWDSTGANVENTLDLEMVGSTAPGARLYNVYGPTATFADLDQAFSTILSPPSTLPPAVRAGLRNVTVISNSWGGPEQNDSGWYSDIEQAQARGISVLASSGDSGDNPSSGKYVGTTVEFPSAMAYDAFGVTAVGGTTDVLDPSTLHLQSQIAWNISATDTADGGPAGSTGGVSSVFPEPSWQTDTSANSVIQAVASGRGVPDIAAIANNTLMTLSVRGYEYRATNATSGGPFDQVWGTSVASPLVAGLIAEIDHVLVSASEPPLGFLDPVLYHLAKMQYAPLPNNSTGIGAEATGAYHYSLPTAPFDDVTSGSNYLYPARPGYDLVTGWGSLDAYNYTMYVLNVSSEGTYGHLSAIQDRFDLTGLRVSSPGVTYNASLQQNFFLANSLGAPVDWVQNVVYIAGSPGGWQMRFTGWVIFPFYPNYPADTVYEYNWPASALTEATPIDFNITTELVNPGSLSAEVEFSFGVSGTSPLALPVPGASFIVGSRDYNYSWQGINYSNNGTYYPGGPGFLSPQFGLVGGPSLGIGDFQSPTAGTLSVWLAPWGSTTWHAAITETFGLSVTQTGEQAQNLLYTPTGAGTNRWSLGTQTGSRTQGVLGYESAAASRFTVQFNQTGAPTGTSWYVNLSNGVRLSGLGSAGNLTTTLPTGTYDWTASIGRANWAATPDHGTFTVAGTTVFEDLVFAPVPTYLVQFNESGVPRTASWYVNLSGGPRLEGSGTAPNVTASLVSGAYAWTAAIALTNWTVRPDQGTVDVGSAPVYVDLVMAPPPDYLVEFQEQGLPTGTAWQVTFQGSLGSGSGPSISFRAPNGSYPFSIGPVTGYTAAPASGTLGVNGAAVTESIAFTPIPAVGPSYPVTFRETGLPAGGSWSVTLNGNTQSSSSATVVFPEPNDSYSFTIGTVSGYRANVTSGHVTVSGSAPTVWVGFAPTSGGGGSGPSFAGWSLTDLVVVGVAVVVLVALGVALAARGRRRRGNPPSTGTP